MFDDDDIENLDDGEELEEEQGSSKSLKDIIDEARNKEDDKEKEEDDKEKEKDKDKESPETDKENPETNKENPETNKENPETDKENPEKDKESHQEQKKPEKEDPDSKAIEDAKNKNDNELKKGNENDLSKKNNNNNNNNQNKKENPKNDTSNKLSDNRKNQENKFGKSEDNNNPVKNAIDKGKKKVNDRFKKPEGGTSQKAKEGAKKAGEKVGKAAKEGLKKAGKAAKEGLKKIWAALPLQVKIVVLIILAVLILISLIIFITLLVVGGADNEEYANNGTCSYNYSAADSDTMSFLANMASPVGDYKYSISSPFGWRVHPIYSNTVFHKGIDITGSGILGKEVYAVQDGKIISITPNHSSAGNWIKIQHSGNYVTEYMHLNSFADGLEVGDSVAKGTKIGYVGNTGDSTGPHLDFRIRKDDTYLSPDPFFGISDIGFEQCLKRDATDYSACNEDNRLSSKIDFKQIVSECNCDSGTASGSLLDFIIKAEGTTGECTLPTGEKGYIAKDIGDGTITAGPGVTNYALPGYKNIVINSNATRYFTYITTGEYVMQAGTCVPKKVIDEIMVEILKETRGQIQKEAESKNVTLKEHQIDSIISLSYNFGSSVISDCIEAYKNYSSNGYSNQYEGIWGYMKQKVNFGTQYETGHKSRRKAEFELFVTGDYNIKVYGRDTSNYDNYNSDNVMSRVK